MRRTFQLWLFIAVALSFAALFYLTYYLQTKEAFHTAENLIELRMEDAKKQIAINENNLKAVLDICNSSMANDVKAVAYILACAPAFATNSHKLEELRRVLGYDEIHVINKHGIIENCAIDPMIGNADKYVGFNLKLHAQSEPFVHGIGKPDFVLVQPPLPRGLDRKLFQYGGAARQDDEGIVQLGISVSFLEKAMENNSLATLSPGLRVGVGGEIMILRGEKIVGAARVDFEGRTLTSIGLDEKLINDICQGEGLLHTEIEGVKFFGVYIQSGDLTLIGVMPDSEVTRKRNGIALQLVISGLVLMLVVFLSVSKLVQTIVIDGIDRINVSLGRITAGHLDEKVEEDRSEEFRKLSGGINTMVDTLKGAIAAEKSRLNSELEFAKMVQESTLPQLHSDPRFQIFASMDTAKEVGGDFYDFFRIDDTHLAFLIADVSGKGLPAAMFMMNAKALLKSSLMASAGKPLDKVVASVNDSLCEGNDACMFVTVFVGILDLDTGNMTYVNAGHNAPILRRGNGEVSWLPVENGFVLGGMDSVSYTQEFISLSPGDGVLLYTDGVTEAMNRQLTLYGDDRLLALMQGPVMSSAPPDCVLTELKDDVENFVDGAPQSDDITMLFLHYLG
ncbi:SpoIIE family protein phosphatase [bacterium]|nr:SpoIIE family protein phosphatase [bacterium]